ncbi:MAG: ParA family protein [Desulfobacteraceae bacterium]|nr:ParA family protein [Desulfobacteraceae bacterium]
MLIAFDAIRRIEKNMAKLKHEGRIADYRLILKLNMSANLIVVTNRLTGNSVDSVTEKEQIEIDIDSVSEEEFNSDDDYYVVLFRNTKPLDMGLRRSLSNMIEYDDDEKISSCPIVSFYSYKGGVGRTTALAMFASYYSIHHAKKVFITDCDFEAPGLINFFGFTNEDQSKNGIVEYIKDQEAFHDRELSSDYVFEVSRTYSKDGEIYILPAGNTMNDPDRGDYIEALARLDIHSTDTIVRQFRNVIADINKKYKPDVILIDSKTGFNDIFGIIVNKLSDIIVGFFGNNVQNKPGLYFFLDTLMSKKRNTDLILVNAILSSSVMKKQKSFQNDVDDYIQNNLEGSVLESLPVLPVFGLSRYPVLEDIGTQDDDPDDFISSVEQGRFGDYQALFQNSSVISFTKNIDAVL